MWFTWWIIYSTTAVLEIRLYTSDASRIRERIIADFKTGSGASRDGMVKAGLVHLGPDTISLSDIMSDGDTLEKHLLYDTPVQTDGAVGQYDGETAVYLHILDNGTYYKESYYDLDLMRIDVSSETWRLIDEG